MEHRSALIVDAELTTADGYAERATALEMLARLPKTTRRRTVAGDKGYDTKGFVADARALGFTPHVAQNMSGEPTISDRRPNDPTCRAQRVSMRIRKRIEEPFGWIKTIGGGRKLRYIGRQRNRAWFKITAAVYNLIRITALDTQTRLTTGRRGHTGPEAGPTRAAHQASDRPDGASHTGPNNDCPSQPAIFRILLTEPITLRNGACPCLAHDPSRQASQRTVDAPTSQTRAAGIG